jgi:hypothetical protein
VIGPRVVARGINRAGGNRQQAWRRRAIRWPDCPVRHAAIHDATRSLTRMVTTVAIARAVDGALDIAVTEFTLVLSVAANIATFALRVAFRRLTAGAAGHFFRTAEWRNAARAYRDTSHQRGDHDTPAIVKLFCLHNGVDKNSCTVTWRQARTKSLSSIDCGCQKLLPNRKSCHTTHANRASSASNKCGSDRPLGCVLFFLQERGHASQLRVINLRNSFMQVLALHRRAVHGPLALIGPPLMAGTRAGAPD